MDEFKPEDELKPDPSDRRTGRSRQSSERSERTERGEPQINFDDIELDDTDDRRPTRAQKERKNSLYILQISNLRVILQQSQLQISII